MPSETDLKAQLKRYGDVLDERARDASVLDDYREGRHPLPPMVQDTGLTKAYRMLMELSGSNWPGLIVEAVEERLEVQGIRFGDEEADEEAWGMWQDNGLDAESSALHDSVLTTGRGYAIVWGDGTRDPAPKITYEHASMCMVEYEPGSHRKRRGALRRWKDGHWYANLYTPESIYKFKSESEECPTEGANWKRRDVKDEKWPLDNSLEEVPVVEFAVNRSLRPNPYGTGRGEFTTNLRHVDRINYKVFSGLVALTWSGFPLRYVIGDPIFYEKKDDGTDDKTKPIPPFDAVASAVAQFTNKDTTVGQLPEANVENYSPEMDIKHLAAVTKTPAYYLLGELVNISADGIRAGEGGLISKIRRHHRSLGESHEDVTRLGFRVKNPDDPRGRDQSAHVDWKDPESRSLAERADAAVKLKETLPAKAIMQFVLGMTPQEISRADADSAGMVLERVLAQQVVSPPVAAANGGQAR